MVVVMVVVVVVVVVVEASPGRCGAGLAWLPHHHHHHHHHKKITKCCKCITRCTLKKRLSVSV